MAKKRIPNYKKFGGGQHRYSKTISSTESLRFRDKNGRLTKFDARKKLIAEIYNRDGQKTGRVLNKTRKGKPILQKFESRKMRARLLAIAAERAGFKEDQEQKSIIMKMNVHHTITDNITAKCDDMLSDIAKFTRHGNAGIIVIEFKLENGDNITIQTVERSTNKENIALNLARLIINRLYKNSERMSGIKKTKFKGDGSIYVKKKHIKFTWFETKRIKTI